MIPFPCGCLDLPVSFGVGKDKRIVDVHLFVISCERVYNDIIGKWFLTMLDAVTSTVHLKMKYHNNFDKLVVIATDIRGNCKDDTWFAGC